MVLVCLISLGALLVVAYWQSLGRYTFVLMIEKDGVRMLKGHVPDSFITFCQTVSFITPAQHRVIVRGDRHLGQLRLTFSRHVDETTRQKLRNQFPYSAYGNAQLDWKLPNHLE
ncbi:DUF3634 family protein [Celerinatantimonas sp. MCCC 1A17872]|uniref:DUF3634 family protein n=1 Tax=Celerinatantimonas sp. MCCC 1A17872 TaxID=3177514 RepID=UPI0038C9DF3B